LDLKRLRWRDLVATDINGSVEMNDTKYTFSPVEMRLMGEPAMIEGYVVAAPENNTKYDLNISCQNLPLNPLVHHFHPGNEIEWGRLTANCYVKGEALRGVLFKRTFHARGIDPDLPATLKIEGAKWGFKEDRWFIGILASPLVLDLPQLLNSHFNGAKLEITAGQGKADFKLGAQGPLLIAATEGQGDLGERFIDSKVNQNVEIALQQILAKKFLKLELKKQDAFWPIPKGLLRLSGPIRRPKPSVNPLVVAQLTSQRLTRRPINVLLAVPGVLIGESGAKNNKEKIDPFDLLDNQKERNQFNPLDLLRLFPGID
jgi:hypothetical protein